MKTVSLFTGCGGLDLGLHQVCVCPCTIVLRSNRRECTFWRQSRNPRSLWITAWGPLTPAPQVAASELIRFSPRKALEGIGSTAIISPTPAPPAAPPAHPAGARTALNAHQAGHEIILQCESDPGAQQVLKKAFPGTLLVPDVCALTSLPKVGGGGRCSKGALHLAPCIRAHAWLPQSQGAPPHV